MSGGCLAREVVKGLQSWVKWSTSRCLILKTAIVYARGRCQYLPQDLQIWGQFSDLQHGPGRVRQGAPGRVEKTPSTVAQPIKQSTLSGDKTPNPESPDGILQASDSALCPP